MNDEKNIRSVPRKNKIIGWILIAAPIIVIGLTLITYAVLSYITAVVYMSEGLYTVVNLISVVLFFVGIIAIYGFHICIPLGIVFANKKELHPDTSYDKHSGMGRESVVPSEVKGWNWGAAGLTWIWGAHFSVWISMLAVIPFVGFIMIVVLGIKGSEWAWKAQRWESIEVFKESQARWRPWGVVILLFVALQLSIVLLGLLSSVMAN